MTNQNNCVEEVENEEKDLDEFYFHQFFEAMRKEPNIGMRVDICLIGTCKKEAAPYIRVRSNYNPFMADIFPGFKVPQDHLHAAVQKAILEVWDKIKEENK